MRWIFPILFFSFISSFAAAKPTITCDLSYHENGKWQPCGRIQLSDGATSNYSHGPRGKCEDLTFLMARFGDGQPDRDDALIIARSTKKAENDESTWLTFSTKYPDRFKVMPHFTKRAAVSIECTVTDIP